MTLGSTVEGANTSLTSKTGGEKKHLQKLTKTNYGVLHYSTSVMFQCNEISTVGLSGQDG